MRKAIRHYTPLTLLLQAVIANGLGGVQRLFQVTGFQNALLLHIMAPDTGKAVRLKLHTHGQTVHLRLRRTLLHLTHLRLDTQQLLYMVADFMRNDIALRKIAARAKLVFMSS